MKRGLTTNTDTIRRIYRIQDDKAVYYEDSNQNVFTDAFGRHSRHITTSRCDKWNRQANGNQKFQQTMQFVSLL